MGLMNRVAPSRVRLNFTRYTAASAIATTITQVVLLAFALLGNTPVVLATTIAFAAGAVPQFLIMRRWASGPLSRQLTTFVMVTLASGVASIGMVALVDQLIGPTVTDRGVRALALNAGYLIGGAPIFLAKFFVLDRTFFASLLANHRALPRRRAREAAGFARVVLRRVRGGQLDQGAGGETRGAGRDVVVRLLGARRSGNVKVGPWQAGGELPEKSRGADRTGSGRALPDVGDVARHRVG